MKQYLLYGQVQKRLDDHVAKHGVPFSFYEAVRELWLEKQFITSSTVTAPDFARWDTKAIDEFDTYINNAPVYLENFPSLPIVHSPTLSSQHIYKFDVLPMKIAVNQAMGLHMHDSFEMTYVIRGKAKIYLNENMRILSEGEMCLITPHFQHDVIAEKGAIVISISFWEHTIENTLFKLLKGENIIVDFFRTSLNRRKQGFMLFNLPVDETILRVIRDIFHEGYSSLEYARVRCVSYIEILFSHLLRYYSENASRTEESKEDSGSSSILSILKYIQSNFRETNLKSVAEAFHYETGYLGKKIKSQTGKNFTEIISELRIQNAISLLQETDFGVDKIAEMSGFNNRVHFSRSFKDSVGVSPGAYRKQNGTASK